MANDKNFKVKNGLDTGSTITTPSHGTSANWKSAYDYSQVGHLPLSGGTLTGELIIDTSTNNYFKLYTEGNTATIADTFGGNTDKSYIYFYATSGSNDPGYIMHETRSGDDSNEGVLHLVPSDDNSTGDYVSIHGTNDADVLKLHTSGLIETATNYQLQLRSGNGSVKVDDSLQVVNHITASGAITATGSTIGNLNSTDDIGQQLEYGNADCATLRFDSDRWRVWAGGASGVGEILTVLETGNVGVGYSTPGNITNKLSVNGVISATGGTSTNWNTAYSNHLTGLSFSGGTLTASKQTGTETVSLDGRYLKITDFSGTLDAAYARTEKATITGVNSSSYVTAFNVVGNDHSAGVRASFGGTSANVVVNVLAEIMVGHSKDITIKTTAGFYTVLTIKVTSNDNDDYAVEIKHNGSSTTSIKVEVFPQGSETITFPSSHSYTGQSLEHVASRGVKFTSVDGSQTTKTDLDIDGNYKVAGTTVIDTEKKGIFEGLTIDSNENNGITITEQGDTNGDSSYNVMRIRSTPSGSTTLTGDRIHSALYIDIDQTATGHNGSNDFQNYGVYVDNRSTGATQMKGVYARVESQNSSDTSDSIIAVDGIAVADETGTARTTTVIGLRGIADGQGNGSGGTTTLYGVQGNAQLNQNTASDNHDTIYGGRFEINYETPSNGESYTPANAYVVGAVFDDNSVGKFTTNKSYLFYGDYQIASSGSGGVFPTNAYGLYLTDSDADVVSYIGHNLGIGDTTPEEKLTVSGNIKATGTLSASGYNDSNWNTAYTYSQVGHLPLTGGSLTGALNITTDGSGLVIKTSTNASGAQIEFSDHTSNDADQEGTITFRHADSQSYGSGALFEIGSNQSTTTILADGKLMYNEGIYSKPATGTGAGTRKDENWDTAYTYSQVGHLPLAGGTITGGITLNNNFVQNTANKNFITSGKQITDLDDAWSNGVTYGKSVGIQPFRYQNTASNMPTGSTGDNANWGLNIYSHSGSNESAEAYGLQLSGRNNEAGALYLRRSSNGTFSAWRKVWHEGNDGAASGLDADLLDGQHGSYYAPINAPDFTGGVDITGPTTITSGSDEGLKITHNDFADALILHRNHTSNAPAIKFTNNSGTGGAEKQLGVIFVDSDAHFKFRDFSTSNQYKVYHEGIFTNNSSNWNTAYGDKVNSIDFNTSDGILTLNRQDGGTVTKDLDGRYALLSGSTISGEIQTQRVKRWVVADTSNIADDRWYKIATLDGGNSGITIRGTLNNHVESFGTQKFDLSFFGRADNSTDEINVAGTFEIANAGSGGRGVGIRVIQIPDAGTYDDRDVYIRLTRYSHANVTIYIEGNTSKVNVNLDQSSSNYVTTEPSAGTNDVNLVFDNTSTAEGHYSVMNNVISEINTTVGTDTDVTTSGATIIDDLTLTQGVITAASTRTLSLSDLGYTGATNANNYTLPTATSVTKGGIELWDNTVQDTAAQAVTSTANRTYGIQLNSNGQAVVNVPWTTTGDDFLGITPQALNSQGNEATATTAQVIAELEGLNAFDHKLSALKTSWSYAGNNNISDAGDFGPTELAGTSWLNWTDNSSNSTRGNITSLVIAPTTGGSAGGVYVYNDQGSSYSPGWREIWTSSTDGSGSGLDADLLDGVQGSGYLRSSAADTADELITFAKGINVGDYANGGITGNNYNISGVNQITINDPGEGIIWAGTNGSDPDVTLYVIDDDNDSIVNIANATDLQVNGESVKNNASIARALGWVPGYSNNDEATLTWNATEDAVELQSDTDTAIGMVHRAFEVRNGETYKFSITVKGSEATANDGLYLRIYGYNNSSLPAGKTHVSNDASYTLVQEDAGSMNKTNWQENVAVPDNWTTYETTYTPGSDGWVSLVVLNWTAHGTKSLYVKQPNIHLVKSSDADKLDGQDGSYYINTSGTAQTKSGNLTVGGTLKAGLLTADGSGDLLKTYVSSWSGNEDQSVLRNQYNTTIGDYLVVKASGNSSTHGAINIADQVFAYGTTNKAGDGAESLTAPLSGATSFTVTAAGAANFAASAEAPTLQGSTDVIIGEVDDHARMHLSNNANSHFGFDAEHSRHLIISNEQGSTNQVMYLADSGATANASIWGVSLTTAGPTTGGAHLAGSEAYTNLIDLDGLGTLKVRHDIISNNGGGSIALTSNDGYGNANVTFNHVNGVPDQNGQSGRIEVNTDATGESSKAYMQFELSSSEVTSGTAVGLTQAMKLEHNAVTIPYKLTHAGDTNTYLQFDADRIRLVAGGTTKIDTNNASGHVDVSGGVASPIGNVSGVNAQGEVVLVAAVSHNQGHITGGTTATFTSDGQVIFNQTGTLDIKANSITANNIKANTIDTDKLAANTITAKHIEASSVVADLITANSIKADTIAANAITTDKLAANSINTDKLAANTITTKHIEATSVVSNLLSANSVKAANIKANTITSNQINAASATFDNLVSAYAQISDISANNIDTNVLNSQSIIARTIRVASGTVPAISGTTVSGGKGALINSDGDFFVGDPSASHMFFDQSEGKMHLRSGTSGARMALENDTLKVFDASGNLRVHLGNLSS